jgi:hypothetical protein
MDSRYHRGYRVDVSSFRSGSGWRIEVSICPLKDTRSLLTLPSPSPHWSAATKEEADRYGLEMAKAWIANMQE